ncbi:hypothetical protein [Neobacillus ginsengisoli]|uniref:RNase H type-1 domain-containing protein n=1 Tax=Neobacillus ginsengisoli TaxID=904295 RepID=A0ABT9Y2Z0_9BACI|nr:hypothetical protein [Neobacillus ginsengisoli]MDQ0202172.1 hypothetical protein [Neobacillus ginsengisoli]
MFVAYTDASIRNQNAILAFVIFFEDKSKISKRIVINQTNNNIAEASAFKELISFLDYYNFKGGLILFDSNGLKSHLKRSRRKTNKYLSEDTKEILRRLSVRTQVIPRKYNVAHQVCSENKSLKSTPFSSINRHYYQKVEDFPDYLLQLSVLEEYRQIYNKRFATFHEAQMKLNKKIWSADLLEDLDGVKMYAIHDKRIKVHGDTIIKLTKVNNVQVGSHWRAIRKLQKLN